MKSITLCVITFSAIPLFAGVRIQTESTEIAANKVSQQETLIDATRLRVNLNEDSSVLFLTDGGRNRMVMLDKRRNEYREIDQQTMDQVGKQMQSAMAQMEEQMKNMPPQQREMMEKMMKGRMPQMGAAAVKTVYSQKGKSTVNGFACTQYEGTRNGEKAADVCAASPSVLKFSAADTQVFEKMREFMSGMMSALANSPFAGNMNMNGLGEAGFEGYPVQRITFSDGKPSQKQELKSAASATFTDADFSLGSAKKVEMPMGPRGGR